MQRPTTFTALLALACLSATSTVAEGQPSAPRTPTAVLRARIDSLFDPWRGTDRPGCAVAVGQGGRVLHEAAFGMADLESAIAMTPDRVLHSASLAKQVTALAVLLLVRDGRLSLDDDVRRHLPTLPDLGDRITIRHLLTHTSGIRDVFEMLIAARGRFEEARITMGDAMSLLERQDALNFRPGTDYGYSNSGYLLAARVIERVSGEPFADFVHRRIFEPLGMSHSRIRHDVGMLVPGRAVGYARAGAGWRTSIPNFDIIGSTNLQTTVADLLRLGGNLARPVVGDSALVAAMLTPAVLSTGDTTTYGLGLSLQRDRGMAVAEHEGRDPGFRAYFGWYRVPDLTVALLCNTANVDPVGLGHRVAAVALGDGVGVAPAAPSPPPLDSAAARTALRWAGVYLEPSTRQVAELTVRDGILYTDRTGGARVEALSARQARLVGVPLELHFDSSRAAHPGYAVHWSIPGRRVDRFEWVAPATIRPRRAELQPFAGDYHSTMLQSAMRVQVRDSTLTLTPGGGAPLDARPVFADAFVSGPYTIRFTRSDGRITGFEISHPRARGMRYSRAPASGDRR